jgi:uncharacterized lipoprotein YddW (UPF0748 family)
MSLKLSGKKLIASVMAAVLWGVAAMQAKDISYGFGSITEDEAPVPKHELRGAWLATVYGIDWPSKAGSSESVATQQKQELIKILDVLQRGGFNAVMMQVRSMSDAMYKSHYEPWSSFLTGARGTAPAGSWDPLAFAVSEAHKRGLELHAWVNPYRLANGAAPAAKKAAVGSEVFDPQGKGWVITFGDKTSILDPGNPNVRQHVVDVCRDIVANYDVDGLVFDDYFYPDKLPLDSGYDYDCWKEVTAAQGDDAMSQADWRRNNVALTVSAVYKMLQSEAPWVRFGISPAGVAGGNGKSSSRYGLPKPERGNDWMYDRIFCDPLQWLDEGSVDYVSPQVYWATSHATNPYEPIVKWWGLVAEHFHRHCYPSQKVLALPASNKAWQEQVQEVEINRDNAATSASGSILYSTAHINGKKAEGVAEYMRGTCYKYQALMPPMEWKKAVNPGKVTGLSHKGATLSWYPITDMRYVVYAIPNDVSPLDAISDIGRNFMAYYIMCVTYGHEVMIDPAKLQNYWYAVAPYDRYGNEWEAVTVK